jgi:hypothetical protein
LAASDFFTAEVLTLRGLVTYYVLFFIYLESRRVDIAPITVHPKEAWMKQIARNVTMDDCGALRDCRFLLHDRDTKFTRSFRAIIASGPVKPLALPARRRSQGTPKGNQYAFKHGRYAASAIAWRRVSERAPWTRHQNRIAELECRIGGTTSITVYLAMFQSPGSAGLGLPIQRSQLMAMAFDLRASGPVRMMVQYWP